METANEDIIVAIIIASIVAVILAVFTLLFFLIFIRKQRILTKKKDELTLGYEKLLLETKLEIQQQTLNNISLEIHDNIGQVLSFIKLSLATASRLDEGDKQEVIDESVQLVAGVINDLRDLSKSLSLDKIKKAGLYSVIKDEADRLNKRGIIETTVGVEGTPFRMDLQTDMVLYRIFQEIINNTLKHSQSKILTINLAYALNLFTLTIKDSGIGFDTTGLNKSNGQGLGNIRQRAELIDADILIDSELGLGCSIKLILKRPEDNDSANA